MQAPFCENQARISMINLDPLLRDLPSCVHSVLESFPNPFDYSVLIKADKSKTTPVDIELQKRLQDLLVSHFPTVNAWGEESFIENCQVDYNCLNKGEHWVIDPLDGTTNFINDIPAFCTTMSLIVDGVVVAGVTYDPKRKELFYALKSKGVFFNGEKVSAAKQPTSLQECVTALDFKRLSPQLREKIASAQPYYSQRNFGSSGIEWAWLSINRVNVYLHGSQCLWDYASGLLFIQELGGVATNLHGESLHKLSLDKSSIIASQCPKLHQYWMEFLHK